LSVDANLLARPIKKHIALVGFYGKGNFGDELMLNGLVERLAAYFDISVIAYDVAPLWIEEEDVDVNVVKYAHAGARWRRLPSLLRVVEELRRADLVVFGGGTFLFDNVAISFRNMGSSLRTAVICRLLRKQVAHLGIGIGRLTTKPGQRIARFILRSSDLITVRDNASLVLARRMASSRSHSVHRTADLAYLHEHTSRPVRRAKEANGSPFRLVVCGQEFHQRTDVRHSETALSAVLASCLDAIIGEFDAEIQFVPMRESTTHDDNRFHRQIVDRMVRCERTAILTRNADHYSGTATALREADLVVGMRLHSLVAALAAGRPLFGLVQTQKVRQLIAESGLEEFSQEVDQIDDVAELRARLTETIASVKRGAYPGNEEYVARQRKLAERNIELLLTLTDNRKR
jgi:polysaccharide pyruvyl transferase WcaK-like protein